MSPTATAESTVAESTATETMLDAISTMESAAVIAAEMVRTAIAVRAAINAASQNDDGGHCKKRVERPLPFAELQRWFVRFLNGLFVDKSRIVHT